MYSRVVILTNLTNSHKSLGILVWRVWVNMVEGIWVRWVTITGCEVNAHSEVDLAASHDVVKE